MWNGCEDIVIEGHSVKFFTVCWKETTDYQADSLLVEKSLVTFGTSKVEELISVYLDESSFTFNSLKKTS